MSRDRFFAWIASAATMTRGQRNQIMRNDPGKAEEKKEKWLKIELFAPLELSDALTNFLTEIGAQGAFQESLETPPHDSPGITPGETLMAFLPLDADLEQRLNRLRTYLDSVAEIFPELEKPGIRTEAIHDPDWGEAWKKYFKPLRVGRNVVIKPTWEGFTPKGGDIVIEIDPGMAFGTGQHASTRMCLEAIESIFMENRTFEKPRVLDVGTGTGILGIACAKLGAQRVLCVDNDPLATKIAQDNVLVNQVEGHVTVADVDIATLTEPFPLIVANLTAKILCDLFPHLCRLVSAGGRLIISGIIEQNRPDIEARFLDGSFTLDHLITEQEWVCYVLKKVGGRQ
jgi:ribosomal protein L11 methyltransferase